MFEADNRRTAEAAIAVVEENSAKIKIGDGEKAKLERVNLNFIY